MRPQPGSAKQIKLGNDVAWLICAAFLIAFAQTGVQYCCDCRHEGCFGAGEMV
ncbi:hypothetical protein J22TS3_23200 [Paenibacillus sp. J22TS3]|nr:hypothetical protein J22TS3_23200 [Paenibacillus sp. J22TS3]